MTSAIEAGAKALGIRLHPHQLELGTLLDEGCEITAIQWPRRAGKTTSVWAWMLGKAITSPGTLIAVTAQTRMKARARWAEVAAPLERATSGDPHIRYSIGSEQFEWVNGSRLWVVPPKPEAFRSDAADIVYVDEPQELDPDRSDELEQAVMPLLDTREPGQVVLSGTPGFARAGWFWRALQDAAADEPGLRASVYAALEGDDTADHDVWKRVHPGIGTLTTLEKMISRHRGFVRKGDTQKWDMEYMGLWPGSTDRRALPEAGWLAGAQQEFMDRPERFGLAYDVSPDGTKASLVAAWRDSDDRPVVELIAHGTAEQIGRKALEVYRSRKMKPTYDQMGYNLEVAEKLLRARPKPSLNPLTMKDMFTAAATLSKAVKTGELIHFDQPDMNAAAEATAWRNVGDNGQLFGRRASSGDITATVAASEALLAYDRMPAARVVRIQTRLTA